MWEFGVHKHFVNLRSCTHIKYIIFTHKMDGLELRQHTQHTKSLPPSPSHSLSPSLPPSPPSFPLPLSLSRSGTVKKCLPTPTAKINENCGKMFYWWTEVSRESARGATPHMNGGGRMHCMCDFSKQYVYTHLKWKDVLEPLQHTQHTMYILPPPILSSLALSLSLSLPLTLPLSLSLSL